MNEDPPSNPFKAFTEESKLYNNITKAISIYKNKVRFSSLQVEKNKITKLYHRIAIECFPCNAMILI